LAVGDRAEEDHARAEPLAHRVDRCPQTFGIQPVHPRHYYGDASHRARARHEILRAALGNTRLHLGELLLQALLIVEGLRAPLRRRERRDPQKVRRLTEGVLLLADVSECRLAGDGLEPADAGRDGALRRDLEESDLTGGVEMRAATELGGEVTDPDDPD